MRAILWLPRLLLRRVLRVRIVRVGGVVWRPLLLLLLLVMVRRRVWVLWGPGAGGILPYPTLMLLLVVTHPGPRCYGNHNRTTIPTTRGNTCPTVPASIGGTRTSIPLALPTPIQSHCQGYGHGLNGLTVLRHIVISHSGSSSRVIRRGSGRREGFVRGFVGLHTLRCRFRVCVCVCGLYLLGAETCLVRGFPGHFPLITV